ncbi:661_t:CDS:1, partial [Ambispora leptoticha]
MSNRKFNTSLPAFKTAKQMLKETNTTILATSNNIITNNDTFNNSS